MNIVEEGDKVELICEARLKDGRVCYKNDKENPFVFTVGAGKFFPAIEDKLKNMKEGETKEVSLEPKDAFGIHSNELVVEIPNNDLNENTNINIGSKVQMKTNQDKVIQGTVTDVKDDVIIVDFNHPLAGKNIVFTVTISSIEKN